MFVKLRQLIREARDSEETEYRFYARQRLIGLTILGVGWLTLFLVLCWYLISDC